MPAKTEKQRRFMGAELSRARAGKKTQTGMSEDKLSEYASVHKAVALIDVYLGKQTDDPYLTRREFDALATPGIAQREAAEAKVRRPRQSAGQQREKATEPLDSPDVQYNIEDFAPKTGHRQRIIDKIKANPRSHVLYPLNKSMNLVDVYLFKHGHVLPCGHHAEEGAEIDKACTSGGCGAMGSTGQVGRSGTAYMSSTDNVSSGIHLPSSGSGSSGGATGSGTMTASSPPEGGFRRSADSIKLINRYLNKQSRVKCGHKKGDPNHLEEA